MLIFDNTFFLLIHQITLFFLFCVVFGVLNRFLGKESRTRIFALGVLSAMASLLFYIVFFLFFAKHDISETQGVSSRIWLFLPGLFLGCVMIFFLRKKRVLFSLFGLFLVFYSGVAFLNTAVFNPNFKLFDVRGEESAMAEFELRRISEGELRQVLKVAPLHWALYTEAALYKNIGDINVPEWRRVSDEISVQPIWGGEIVLRDKSCGYDSEDSVSECLFEEGEHDVVLRHSVGRQDKNHGFFWGTDPLVWLKEVQISLKAPVGSPSLQEQCLRTYQDISWREIPNEFCERLSVSPEGYNERYKVFSAKETAE